MSDLIIYIGDEAIDLSENQVISITKQAAKVGDFSKVLANGTNTINVPPTARNKAIFGNCQVMQTDSGVPYTRMKAKMVQEGFETIQNGFAIIDSVGDDFTLQLIAGNASFFLDVANKNVRDLDLKAYDHFWTNANVFANRNNSTGLNYNLFEQLSVEIDTTDMTLYSAALHNYKVKTEYLLPCFFVPTIMEMIFDEAGYEFQSDITSLNIYQKLCYFEADNWNRGLNSDYLNIKTTNVGTQNLTGIGFFLPVFPAGIITEQGSNFWNAGQPDPYKLPDNQVVTLSIIINFFNNDVVVQPVNLTIPYTTKDGSASVTHTFNLPVGASTQTFTTSFDCVQNEASFDCQFRLLIEGDLLVDVTAGGEVSAEFELLSSLQVTTRRNALSYIRGVSAVPDMQQSDFIKEIASIFQLVFNTDPVNKVVTAVMFEDIRNNIPYAKDFSGKIDATPSKSRFKFRIDGYAKTNYLQWKPDDITKYNGRGIINCPAEIATGEKVILEMKTFAASSTVIRFDTKEVPFVPIFGEVDPDGVPSNGLTSRLFIARRETFPYTINFHQNGVDLPTDDVTFAYFAEAGNTDSLDFSNLVPRFFNTISGMLESAKVLSAEFKLGIVDVYNYDPFIPVYISQYNNYFYLEKIENYVKDKLTRLTLIKL